jgi:PiT family inorganic phosphate transporter
MTATLLGEVSIWTLVFLVLAVGAALSFEFVNGFHDTANAVATVIYTHTLKPTPAVVWSGIWNLIGVLTSSGAVAFGILSLLPVELVLNVGSAAGFAMVFSLLLSAIAWNLGTWYFGLPASSSHTLVGSILGVGLANSIFGSSHSITEGVNWAKATEVFAGLLTSPVIGFLGAAGLLLLTKKFLTKPELYRAPEGQAPPPNWIRGLLLLTCTGVSFAHGSNDGQKGMGLIMLILVGILPGTYALNLKTQPEWISSIEQSGGGLTADFEAEQKGESIHGKKARDILAAYIKPSGAFGSEVLASVSGLSDEIHQSVHGLTTLSALPEIDRGELRTAIYLVSKALVKMERNGCLEKEPKIQEMGRQMASASQKMINFIPVWVKVAVALALGLGTMIGYQRIVKTVGERIGKQHLSYAQGASAEAVAMGTIVLADHFGLPVSTTHVLSSGVAGTMAANQSGVQMATVRNILTAWVLTLPVCTFLGALLFALILNGATLIGLR